MSTLLQVYAISPKGQRSCDNFFWQIPPSRKNNFGIIRTQQQRSGLQRFLNDGTTRWWEQHWCGKRDGAWPGIRCDLNTSSRYMSRLAEPVVASIVTNMEGSAGHGRRKRGGDVGDASPAVKNLRGDVPSRFDNKTAQIRCPFRFLGYFGNRLATCRRFVPSTQKSLVKPLPLDLFIYLFMKSFIV